MGPGPGRFEDKFLKIEVICKVLSPPVRTKVEPDPALFKSWVQKRTPTVTHLLINASIRAKISFLRGWNLQIIGESGLKKNNLNT